MKFQSLGRLFVVRCSTHIITHQKTTYKPRTNTSLLTNHQKTSTQWDIMIILRWVCLRVEWSTSTIWSKALKAPQIKLIWKVIWGKEISKRVLVIRLVLLSREISTSTWLFIAYAKTYLKKKARKRIIIW